MTLVSSIAFADETKISVPQSQQTVNELTTEVITPEEIAGKYVQILPTYKGSDLGTFNNVDDLATAVMKATKSFESTVSFTYTGDLLTVNEELTNALYEALEQPGNDYTLGTLSSWKYDYTYTGKFTMYLTYIGTLEQENYVTEQVKKIAASLTKPGMTELEKVRAINEYVVTHTEYSVTANNSPHHVYTYLTEGKAVCQAYALLTYRLLTEMGLEARYVIGDAGGPHAWNSVKVDGVWYHLDTTWNDSSFNGADTLSNVSYRYFLVTSETLRKNHTWDEANYPVATDSRYSYFHNIYLGIEHYGDIYYTDASTRTLNKLNLKTGISELLIYRTVYYLEAHNEFIYYADYSNGGYLTAYNITTGETKVIDRSLVKQLQIIDGYLHYKVDTTSKTYKLPSAQLTAAIAAANVTVANNFNKKDMISFKNLVVGAEYTVYKDAAKTKKLTTFTATSSTASLNVDQLGANAGSIYITVKQPFYSESAPTEVKYAAEAIEATPAIAASNVTVTNNFNKADVITLKNLVVGQQYTVYKDAAKTTKLSTFTADSTTKAISIQQLGTGAGSIYVTTTKAGYNESAVTEVKYAAEVVEATPAIAASNVTVTNNVNSKDIITMKNLVKGNTYTIYKDATKKTKLTSFVSDGTTQTITIDQLGTTAGSIFITVKQTNYNESPTTEVKYAAEKVVTTPATNVSFKDMKTTHWAMAYVSEGVQKGYIGGYADNTFKPEQSVTNAEFIKMLATALNPTADYTAKEGQSWYTPYLTEALKSGLVKEGDFTNFNAKMTRIDLAKLGSRGIGKDTTNNKEWMYIATSNGLINGVDSKGTLNEKGTMNRGQAAAVISRVLQVKSGKTLAVDTNAVANAKELMNSVFTDIKNHWASQTILKAVERGYVSGYQDGTFRPDQTVTNAEFVKMLVSALQPNKAIQQVSGSNWYVPYLNEATSMKLASAFEFKDMNAKMIRNDLAKLGARGIGETSNTDNKKWMYIATKAGLITGVDSKGTLNENGTMTRAQAITMIERVIATNNGETLPVDQQAVANAENVWLGRK